jgi:DHA1 family inner membrane transport protein
LALGSLMSAAAGSFALLLTGRIIEGLGFLLVTVAAPALLHRIVAPRDRDFVFGLWSTFMPAGMAIALLCGAAIEGWRGFWFLNAGLTAVAALLVAIIVPRKETQGSGLAWSALARDGWTTLISPGPLVLAMTFALYSLLISRWRVSCRSCWWSAWLSLLLPREFSAPSSSRRMFSAIWRRGCCSGVASLPVGR